MVSPSGFAAAPNSLLYVGSADSIDIERFSIDWATGKLSAQGALPPSLQTAPAWTNAANLIACGSQLYAFGASFATPPGSATQKVGWGMTAYVLNSNGSVSAAGWIGMGTVEPDPIVSNVAVDSSCQYFFRAKTAENSVIETMYDAAAHHSQGFLPVAAGSAPVAVSTDPNTKFLYSANSKSHDVSGYAIDIASGTLTPVPGSPFLAGGQPSSVLVVQSWVYVTNSAENTVSGYSRNATDGSLTPVPGSPFAVGTKPARLASAGTDLSHSPSGMLLYVSNESSNNVSAFTIGTNGSLQPIAGSPFSTGSSPKNMFVAVGPQ